jgi:hypothetical protein
MVSQHGLPYLPLMVMDTLKLVEKHAGKLGIAALKPDYKILGGTQSLVDALLSRQMDFGVTGVPGLATLWDKTAGTPNEVRALSAVQSMPFMLVTNRPAIRTLKVSPTRTGSRCRRSRCRARRSACKWPPRNCGATTNMPCSTPPRSLARTRTPPCR